MSCEVSPRSPMDSLFPDEDTPARRGDGTAGRAHAAADVRRVRRPGGAARARQAAARSDRARSAAVDHPLGPAGHRQDDAGAHHRRDDQGAVRVVQRRARGHQGNPRGDGRGRAAAALDRPPDHRLHRRDSPLQQGAAGRLSAPRRGRRHRPHRRDDRESVVRGQRRAALALEGVRPARAHDRRGDGDPRARAHRCRSAASAPQSPDGRARGAPRDRAVRQRRRPVGAEPARAERRRGAASSTAAGASTRRASSRRCSGGRCSTTRAAKSTTT